MDRLDKKLNALFSRRSFLAGAGGVAAAGMIAGCSDNGMVALPSNPTNPGYSDADVLNFALNLEYLEAQFYLYAATGKGLSSSDTAAPSGYTGSYTMGTVTPGSAAAVAGTSPAQIEIINEIAAEEQQHVRFLRAALKTAAVPMPSIDLSFFGPLAVAAGITTSATGSTAFNPFSSFPYFLVGAFIFEDVGVTAYAGAAPLISAAGVAAGDLTAAAGILAVEAYHAAYIRTSLVANALSATGGGTTDAYVAAANKVATLRATLTVGNSATPSLPNNSTGNTGVAGSANTVEVLLTVPTSVTTPTTIVAADSKYSIGFARNVNQVAHIVYGSATVGVKSGGFFPSGMNSIFATTTA